MSQNPGEEVVGVQGENQQEVQVLSLKKYSGDNKLDSNELNCWRDNSQVISPVLKLLLPEQTIVT